MAKIKHLIVIIVFTFITITKYYGQLSINSSPIVISPSFSVVNSTSVSYSGTFKNIGVTPLTGTITINLAINTSTTSTPNYVFRNQSTYTVSGFTSLATNTFVVTDIADVANQYKIDGSGTTVVVWPIFNTNTLSTEDSAFTVIYVYVPVNINELSRFEANLIKIENPLIGNMKIEYDKLIYKRVELINNDGKLIQVIENDFLNISLLTNGFYYLNFYNNTADKIISKKILIIH